MKKYCLLLMLGISAMYACKKSSAGPDVETPPEPILTDKGTPEGTAVLKTIGPAGGTLESSDGMVTVTVPAGTVAANTQFGIQPITNTLSEGSDVINYRLTPEGSTFSKPVTVSFSYDQEGLKGAPENGIYVAYQTPAGTWRAVSSVLNKTAKTVNIATTHFSDWSITGALMLTPTKKELVANEETHFKIEGMTPIKEDDDLLAPLTNLELDGWVRDIRNFKIIKGPGSLIDITGDDKTRIYRAPDIVSEPKVVEVQVQLLSDKLWVKDTTMPDDRRYLGQVTLLNSINLVGDNVMSGSFIEAINTDQVFALYSASTGKIHITAHTTYGSFGFTLNGNSAKSYPCGDPKQPGTCLALATRDVTPNPYAYGSQYDECGPPRVTKYSDGVLELERWGAVGEPVQGTFTGLLYSGVCDEQRKRQLKVKFRTIRGL